MSNLDTERKNEAVEEEGGFIKIKSGPRPIPPACSLGFTFRLMQKYFSSFKKILSSVLDFYDLKTTMNWKKPEKAKLAT